jgi:hypothetical protein
MLTGTSIFLSWQIKNLHPTVRGLVTIPIQKCAHRHAGIPACKKLTL